jgi:hypothetical protein
MEQYSGIKHADDTNDAFFVAELLRLAILPTVKGSVNEVVMFSNGPLDFFYAAHNQMASTVMNMTFSLTDPFTPNSPQHELLQTRRKLMDAAKVMILYHHSTRGRLNAEGIGEAVPANNENVAHRPAAWWSELSSKLGVALGKLGDVIHGLRTEMTTAAGEQKPTIVLWNRTVALLELAQLLLCGGISAQRLRHCSDVILNPLFGFR